MTTGAIASDSIGNKMFVNIHHAFKYTKTYISIYIYMSIFLYIYIYIYIYIYLHIMDYYIFILLIHSNLPIGTI